MFDKNFAKLLKNQPLYFSLCCNVLFFESRKFQGGNYFTI
jgi:hypothetical protein